MSQERAVLAAIEILFDPAKIDYRMILEFFFQIHDPTTRNRQGNDMGSPFLMIPSIRSLDWKARHSMEA